MHHRFDLRTAPADRSDMGATFEPDHADGTNCPEWSDCTHPDHDEPADTVADVFQASQWDRKWSHVVPDLNDGADIIQLFRDRDEGANASAAAACLASIEEESVLYCRSLYLFCDSVGKVLAVVQERW